MRLFNTIPGAILLAAPFLVGAVPPADLADVSNEVKLPVVTGWTPVTPGDDYPYQLINLTLGAEILVFKSEIPEESAINNDEELRLSVKNVTSDVVMDFPEARLLTSTGYFEDSRVRFIIEFLSADTASSLLIWHRLAGYVYRHPDAYRVVDHVQAEGADHSRLRWTVDTREDFEFVQQVFEALYPRDPLFDRHAVLALLEAQPWLSEVNAGVRQKKV